MSGLQKLEHKMLFQELYSLINIQKIWSNYDKNINVKYHLNVISFIVLWSVNPRFCLFSIYLFLLISETINLFGFFGEDMIGFLNIIDYVFGIVDNLLWKLDGR